MSIYKESTVICQEKTNKKDWDPKTVSILLLQQNAAIDEQISSFACRLLIRLLTHLNRKTGLCNPSEKSLAEALGVCEKKVWRAVKQLKDNEWIYVKHHYRNSSHYSFNWSKAIKIDLRSQHSERTPVSEQNDCENGQNQHSERTNPAFRTDKNGHLERTPVSVKPIEGNLLNQLIELNLGEEEKNEEEKAPSHNDKDNLVSSHKESVSPPPTFISHNNSAKQADAGEPDQADAADQGFQQFWAAYQPDVSQNKYRPGIRAAFIQKLKDGIGADEIIDGAKAAATTGVNRTTLPLEWLRNEMWKITTPSIREQMEIENYRNARRERLDNERKEVLRKFDDDNSEKDRRRIEQFWGVVNNLLSENTPLHGHSAQWVVDHQQHIDELCASYPDKLLTTLGRRFAQLKTLGTVSI